MNEKNNIGNLVFGFDVNHKSGTPVSVGIIFTQEEVEKYSEGERAEVFNNMMNELYLV